jgi:hypothetical protein
MLDWIARENIKRFRKELENTPNEQKKVLLRQLLAEEEAKMRALEWHEPRPRQTTRLEGRSHG